VLPFSYNLRDFVLTIPCRIREAHYEDDHLPTPLTIHNYLTRVMYNRRTKLDPLWNSILVAGITPPSDTPTRTLPSALAPQDASPPKKVSGEQEAKGKLDGHLFLGYIDLFGTSFSAPHIATYCSRMVFLMCSGFGKYIALPLLRAFYATKGDDINAITKEEALGVIRKCMEVLYYRVWSTTVHS
jgi:20S proteasome subunit beta 7